MSVGLSGILNTATSSLFTMQSAIEVAGHNIANINTPGYARQELIFQPSAPIRSGAVYIGRGVNVQQVQSNQDRYLNYQLFQNNSLLGSLQSEAMYAGSLQEIFNESEDEGLSVALNEFFESLHDLSTTPEGQAERTSVVGMAESLVNMFHSIDSRLDEIAGSANNEVRYTLDDINGLAASIASLNEQIMNMEGSGQNANDFRSQRTLLMEELAQRIDYDYFEDDKGMVNIMVGNGMPLVEGTTNGSLVTSQNSSNNNYYDVYFEGVHGNRFNITNDIEGGSLNGSLTIRDEVVGRLKQENDEMAWTLANEFNAQHQAGYSLNGTTGIDFFAPMGPTSDGAAASIEISVDILADVNNIAAGEIDAPGDNKNALALAQMQNSALFNGGTWTFQEQYSSIVARVGSETSQVTSSYQYQESVTAQIAYSKEAITGVSLEEEMANLIQFQESYEASARLFNTVSEMMDTLTNLG